MRTLAMGTLVLAGCGQFIGTGAPPKVATSQPLSVQIKVSGDERDTVERALAWVLDQHSPVKRTSEGGDRQIRLSGKLTHEKYVMGTDAAFTLQVSQVEGEPAESKRFEKKAITGNLHNEEEKLITDAVVWALEHVGTRAATPVAPAVETAPPEPAPVVAPPPEEPPKKRPRRRL